MLRLQSSYCLLCLNFLVGGRTIVEVWFGHVNYKQLCWFSCLDTESLKKYVEFLSETPSVNYEVELLWSNSVWSLESFNGVSIMRLIIPLFLAREFRLYILTLIFWRVHYSLRTLMCRSGRQCVHTFIHAVWLNLSTFSSHQIFKVDIFQCRKQFWIYSNINLQRCILLNINFTS